jgi:hypothetical protein
MPCAVGTFTVTSFDEDTFHELAGGGRLVRGCGTQAFTGDLDGEGFVECYTRYHEDGTARFVGLHRLRGRVDGRTGSFLVRCVGVFDEGSQLAEGTWTVLDGMATEELTGISGGGHFYVFGEDAAFNLAYELKPDASRHRPEAGAQPG